MDRRRFLPALLLVVAIAATAPIMGEIRNALFDQLGERAVRSLAIGLIAIAAAVFLYAVTQIRDRRPARYAGLVAVAGLLWIQTVGFSRDIPQVDVAEKIHILQYGLLAYLLYRAFSPAGALSTLLLTLVWVTIAGTFEEAVQWFVQSRLGEIRDVGLNVFAGVCGWLLAMVLHPPERWSRRLERPRLVWRSLALMVLVLGLFVNVAHLGYEIQDEEIGRFRSWFSRDELLEVSRQRAVEWAQDPPADLDPWAPEDYFMTEASWHVNHRNASYESGLDVLAWQANRILEKYYDPFLELHSFRTGDPHRYTPERRAELERRVHGKVDTEAYLSPVLVERIYPWPSKPLFFTVLIPIVLLLWWVPVWFSRRDTAADAQR